MACFMQVKVFNSSPAPCNGCARVENCYWIDASEAEEQDIVKCGFCDELRNKEAVVGVCSKCDDKACIACLRRNPYVCQGICAICHSRRVVSLINN